MRNRITIFSFCLALGACAPSADPWSLQGEIPFDGKLLYAR